MLSKTPRESAGAATYLECAGTFRRKAQQQEIVVVIVLSPTIIGRKQGDSVEICLNSRHDRRQSAVSTLQESIHGTRAGAASIAARATWTDRQIVTDDVRGRVALSVNCED